MMYLYETYGLRLASIVKLPDLLPGTFAVHDADVIIQWGQVERIPPAVLEVDHQLVLWATATEIGAVCRQVGTLRIRQGKEVIIDRLPEVNESMLQSALLDAALAAILHQRGVIVLHASAVTLGDGAIAFLGASGEGKSTTATAMCTYGHEVEGKPTALLTDDMVAIQFDALGQPWLLPGFARIKLLPGTLAAVDDFADELFGEVDQLSGKRLCVANHWFPQRAFPLKRLYLLGSGETLAVEPLSPHEAFFGLIEHSYAQAFVEETGTLPWQIQHYSQLLRQVPMQRLNRPRDLSALSEFVNFVEADYTRSVGKEPVMQKTVFAC
jgi:hypothetical protein